MHAAPAPALAGKARNLVVRIGNQARAGRKLAHAQTVQVVRPLGLVGKALFTRDVLNAFANQHLGFRVQNELYAKRPGGAVARMVIRRCADAAAGENHVARRKGTHQRGGDALGVVPHVLRVGQAQPALAKQLDDLGHVLVGTFAGKYLVANDEEAESAWHGFRAQKCPVPWTATQARG